MLQYIDADQLLEVYGGTLKIPEKIWPPPDTYSPEVRASIQPVVPPESETDKYLFTPDENSPKKFYYSVVETFNNFNQGIDTNDLVIAEEGIPITTRGYRTGALTSTSIQANPDDGLKARLDIPPLPKGSSEQEQQKALLPNSKDDLKHADLKVTILPNSKPESVTHSVQTQPIKKCTCNLI